MMPRIVPHHIFVLSHFPTTARQTSLNLAYASYPSFVAISSPTALSLYTGDP